MAPTLLDGDWLLVLPRRPRAGELVVVPDPRAPERLLVKRVRSIRGDLVDVAGDAEHASTDSRAFGPVAAADVIGVPVLRYAPVSRFGMVR